MRIPILALAALLAPVAATAHVTIWPRQSAPGAYERYAVRVPNEKQVATTRVKARFPAEARVISFGEVPGWRIEVVRDAAKRITGATWTGTLPPERFVELPLIAVNPKEGASLTWTFVQTYQDGTRVAWDGAAGSKTPASVVTLTPADAAMGHH